MVLMLKAETKSKLRSADTVPGTAGQAPGARVWVLRMCACDCILVPVHDFSSVHARLHVHVYVIPLNDLFSKQCESLKERENVGSRVSLFSLWKSLHTSPVRLL